MNYNQIKQLLTNNLWYGEQKKNIPLTTSLSVLTIMPNTSNVWGIDISHWNTPPVDLQRMKNQYGLSFVIIKGCDGALKSRYFDEHVAAAKAAGIPFGIYDWLYPDSKISIDSQTTLWSNQAKATNPDLGIFIDAEWTRYAGLPANPSATDLRMAHNLFKNKYGKPATTYTAKGYADEFLIGFDWSREELWVANYGVSSPNLPRGATSYTFWQFTASLDGAILDPNGNKELDGNYFNGTKEAFSTRFGKYDVTHPFVGVETIKGNFAGWDFTMDIIDPAQGLRFRMVHGNKLEQPSEFAKSFNAQLAYNGGEWDKHLDSPNYQMPQDLSISDGKVYVPGTNGRPSLMILEDGTAVIDTIKRSNVKQAITGNWYIVQNGQPVYVTGTEARFTEGHARTVFGIDALGRVIVLISDGTYIGEPDGILLKEAAQLIIMAGAVTAFDGGSGGDSVRVLNGIVTNVPQDGYVRPVPETVMIFSQETTQMRYEAVSNNNMTLRPDHSTFTYFTPAVYIPAGTVMYGDTIWVAPADGSEVKAGDTWLNTSYRNSLGEMKTGWVAIIHKGIRYCTLKDNGVTPPPPPVTKTTTVELTYDDADLVVGIKVDGESWVKSSP